MLDIYFCDSGYIHYDRSDVSRSYAYAINVTDYPKLHKHVDYWEFTVITEGTLENHVLGKGKEKCEGGTLSFMTDSDSHYLIKASRTLRYINIPVRLSRLRQFFSVISTDFEDRLRNGCRSYKISEALVYGIEDLVCRCNMLDESEIEKRDGLLCSAVMLILQELNRIHLDVKDNTPQFVKRLKEITDRPGALSMSVSELEREMNYSSAHMNRLFKQYLDMSPREYLKRLKFRYAHNMLKNTDVPMREISYEIGYTNLSHFFSNFKDIYGITPGECRASSRTA